MKNISLFYNEIPNIHITLQYESVKMDEKEELRIKADNGDIEYQFLYAKYLLDNDIDRPLAFRYFQKAALENHTLASFFCGKMFETGDGVPLNLNKAITFYEKSSSNGDVQSFIQLGKIYFKKDIKKSREYFAIAFNEQHVESYNYMGYFNENEGQLEEAKRCYELGAALGDLDSIRSLGILLRNGINGEKDLIRSSELFRKGAQLEDAVCCHNLAEMIQNKEIDSDEDFWLYYKISCEKNYIKSYIEYGNHLCSLEEDNDQNELGLILLRESVILNDPKAYFFYAHNLSHLFPFSKDYTNEAIYNYEKSIEFHYIPAIRELGLLYISRLNDIELGEMYLYISSADKDAISCLEYAKLIYNGSSKNTDMTRARELFLIAAESSNIDALFYYGLMCLNGEGGEKDIQSAVKYFRKSASDGNYASYYHLYEIFAEESMEQAEEYLRLGIDAGSAQCAYKLAEILEKSEAGVVEARKIYKEYSDKNYVDFMSKYARMCYYGIGGEENEEEGIKYYEQGKII